MIKKLLTILFVLGITVNAYAVKEYAQRYPTGTAMEVYTPVNTPPASSITLDSLSDVNTSGVTTNDTIIFNGISWVKGTITPTESDPIVGAITGLVKANGSGTISAASPGTDYIAPYTSQTAKYFLAAPNASDGTPTFRAILASDIPALSYLTSSSALDGTKVSNADLGEIGVSSGVWSVENAAVIGKVITGFSSGAGALAGTDTILQAINKLDGNVGTKQAALTFGIADTNKVQINAADVADNDYAKFTATGLEGRSYSEVLSDIGGQAADADLTTYAGITPTANAQTLLGQTFAQDQASLSIDDLITLSGVAEGSVNLATFTGTTIADNVTIKAGLQALETAVEGKQASGSYLLATSIDTSAELVTILTNETGSASGTPLLVFNQAPAIDGNIKNTPHKTTISIVNPNAVVTASTIIPIWNVTDAAITITRIDVATSSASYECAGDLKWADARIGLGNAAVIETFDTTSGVRSDTSIASGAVAAGKFIYLSFDSAPNALMTDCVITIAWDYD